MGGITAVFGANEHQDLPKVVGTLDKRAKRCHWPDDTFTPYTGIALLLNVVAANDNQSKQRVVVTAVDPGVVGQRGTHTAAATTTVATTAGITLIELSALRDDVSLSVLVRIHQLAFRRVFYQLCGRDLGVVDRRCSGVLGRRPAEGGQRRHGRQ